MLLWMEELAETHGLHGTDIDADAVTWCREHIPYARVSVNEADPPLAYPDGAFDLVFNHSVFTHLDERRQDQWLTELRRVTRGGGFVILSTTGEVGLPQVALPQDAEVLRDRLEREGIAFLSGSFPPDFPLPDWYQNTLHAPWYVFEHWGRWFDIRGYVPGAALGLQDHVLLQRRPDGDRPRVPLAARPLRTEQEGFERRAVAALAGTRANRAAAAVAPPRFGVAGKFARRLALRAMRPYSAHEDSFDDAVAATIVELARATDHHAALLRALDKQTQTDGQPP
jgi:SAM-dependent methyltransferase